MSTDGIGEKGAESCPVFQVKKKMSARPKNPHNRGMGIPFLLPYTRPNAAADKIQEMWVVHYLAEHVERQTAEDVRGHNGKLGLSDIKHGRGVALWIAVDLQRSEPSNAKLCHGYAPRKLSIKAIMATKKSRTREECLKDI